MSAAVNIARCPEHGLHGERSECFVCDGPVEQVPMVPCDDAAVERVAIKLSEKNCGLPGALPWESVTEHDKQGWRERAEEVLRAAGAMQ